jgi:release factor glutamine methyltransferase
MPSEILTVLDLLKRTTDFLARKGVPNAKLDAELLISWGLKCKRLELYLRYDRMVEPVILDRLRDVVRRRGEREPLQYIIGEVEWGGLSLKVDRRALIPRHETEELWEKLVEAYRVSPPARIADLGTGSGALALALKKSFPKSAVVAVDSSHPALTLALENAQKLGLEIDLIEGSWTAPLEGEFDLIVSNPPYLTTAEVAASEPEVRQWEPASALGAGDNGFADIESIVRGAYGKLRFSGELWLETGIAHAERLRTLSKEIGYSKCYILPDYHRRERFARLVR